MIVILATRQNWNAKRWFYYDGFVDADWFVNIF